MVPRLYISRTPDGQDLPLPSYTSPHHVGLNLQAAVSAPIRLNPMERAYIPVGFSIGIPDGYCGQIVSVPALAHTEGLVVLDGPQIVHPADRGPIFVLVQNTSPKAYVVRRGLVCAQLLVVPVVQVCWNEIETKASGGASSENVVLDSVSAKKENIMDSPRRPHRSIRNRFKKEENTDE